MPERSGKRFCSDPCRYAAWVRLQPKRYSADDVIERLQAGLEGRFAPVHWPQIIEWIRENLP